MAASLHGSSVPMLPHLPLHTPFLHQTPTPPPRSHVHAPIHPPTTRNVLVSATKSTAVLLDLYDRPIPYAHAWEWQKSLVEDVCRKKDDIPPSPGYALLLQHEPVYTLGAGSTEAHLRFSPTHPPHPLYRTERGGEVTYHGPGQLVMYPILNLKQYKTDLHWYLRCLEEVVIRALEEVSGLEGKRIEGLTGVWVGDRKVAAIGVRATRWVTYHGLALNVTTELGPFKDIVPCGIQDRQVTSVLDVLIDQALEEDPYVGRGGVEEAMRGVVVQRQLVEEYRWGLVGAMEEVFEMGWEEIVVGEDAVGQRIREVDAAR